MIRVEASVVVENIFQLLSETLALGVALRRGEPPQIQISGGPIVIARVTRLKKSKHRRLWSLPAERVDRRPRLRTFCRAKKALRSRRRGAVYKQENGEGKR